MAVPAGGGAPIANATREQAADAVLSALVVGTETGLLSIEAEVPKRFICVLSVLCRCRSHLLTACFVS